MFPGPASSGPAFSGVSLLRRRNGGTAPDTAGPFSDVDVHNAYEAHAREFLAVAQRSLGDLGLAQEAVQETFVRAWRASNRFDPNLGTLRGWLFSILRTVIIDLARKRARRFAVATSHDVAAGDQAAINDDRFDVVLNQWVMEQALAQLRDDHRNVILAVHRDGRTSVEIASEFAIPEGTVRSRLYYGLKALRLALEELGWRDE